MTEFDDEFIEENKKITNDIQKVFKKNKYKSMNCITSMIVMSIQQWVLLHGGEKEIFLEIVQLSWDFVESFPIMKNLMDKQCQEKE